MHGSSHVFFIEKVRKHTLIELHNDANESNSYATLSVRLDTVACFIMVSLIRVGPSLGIAIRQ